MDDNEALIISSIFNFLLVATLLLVVTDITESFQSRIDSKVGFAYDNKIYQCEVTGEILSK